MDEKLDIIVTGFDVDARQAEAGLCSVFGLDGARARRFVREVPVVAKRSVSRASAERYVQALQSIGARVVLRGIASGEELERSSSPPAAISSLPVPAPSMIARLSESARVERETLSAIQRFRADEGLDVQGGTPADLDPRNPQIPRPPAVPRDLARMPNAKLPRRRARPRWMLTDPLAQGEDSAPPPRPSPRPHNDAELPPPPSRAPAMRSGGATSRSDPAQRARPASGSHSLRPSAPVGLAHAATASIRPGLGLFSWWEYRQTRRRRRLRDLWPLAVLVSVAAGVYLWHSGALESPAERRERALRAEGIEPGEHAEATSWLKAPDHGIDGLDGPAARELVDRLTRAGARGVLAVQIRATGAGKRARGLAIELPEAAEQRRTLLWLAARARGPRTAVPAPSGRYHLLTFR